MAQESILFPNDPPQDGGSGQDAITFTALGNGEGTIGVGGLLFADSLLP